MFNNSFGQFNRSSPAVFGNSGRPVTAMPGIGLGQDLAAAAHAGKQNPNSAAKITPPKAVPATATGVQAMSQPTKTAALVSMLKSAQGNAPVPGPAGLPPTPGTPTVVPPAPPGPTPPPPAAPSPIPMNPRQQPIRQRTQTDNKQQAVLASLVADGEKARVVSDRSPTNELKSDLMTRGKIASDSISAFDKFATLYKKAKQDNSKPSRSGMGEQNGLSYEQRKEDHATGADAWASLDRFKHKKAGDELLAHTFVDACAAKGMTLDQIADAVIKVSHEFGNDTGAELLNGIEKVAGWADSAYKGFVQPALKGFGNAAKNTVKDMRSASNIASGAFGAYGAGSSGPGFGSVGDAATTAGLGTMGFIAGAASPRTTSGRQQRLVNKSQAKDFNPTLHERQILQRVSRQVPGAAPFGAARGAATFGGIGAAADTAQEYVTGAENDHAYRNLGLAYGAGTGAIGHGTGMGMQGKALMHSVGLPGVFRSGFAGSAQGKLEGGGQVLQARAMKSIGDMGEAEMKIRLPEIAKSMGFEDVIDPVSKLPTRARMMHAGDRFVKDYMHQNLSDLGSKINEYTNPMFQAMGYDTENMTPWQRYSMLGGGAMTGIGALMQNPYMMGAGALGMGYGAATHPWAQQNLNMQGMNAFLRPAAAPTAQSQPQQ